MADLLGQREQNLAARERAVALAREQLDARVAKFNAVQSEFHATSAAIRDQLRDAWAAVEDRQKRVAAEWGEANRFHAEQSAALDARAAEVARRDSAGADDRAKLQRDVAALREEAAALDARIGNSRQVVDELERRRSELQEEAFRPAVVEPPAELQVALDRAADRDLHAWAVELERRERQLVHDRATLQAMAASVTRGTDEMTDRRRVLAEQYEQLAVARAQWQEAEHATVAEMEELARTLRRREAELDARQQRLLSADSRRREDAFDLWQLRLRLEAWQAKVVAYEMRWHTEREAMEEDMARRERELAERYAMLAARTAHSFDDAIPFAAPVADAVTPALPAELVALREELERVAVVMLEAELPEPPDPPAGELPWGSEEAPAAPPEVADPSDEAELIFFDLSARAA